MNNHMPSTDELKELLVGKSIVKAEMHDVGAPDGWGNGPVGYLTLSDDTVLRVWGNDGGCACGSGCYPLSSIAVVENIITNVEVEERPSSDYDDENSKCRTCGENWCYQDGHDNTGYYRIFVFAGDERINIASFEGTDGSGYYGTGWWLDIARD